MLRFCSFLDKKVNPPQGSPFFYNWMENFNPLEYSAFLRKQLMMLLAIANEMLTIEHSVIISLHNVVVNANKKSLKYCLKDTEYGCKSDTY